MSTPPFNPQPCTAGGSGGDAVDLENLILCDVLPDGSVVGAALAVYDYSTGSPSAVPTFVDPLTGAPYVPTGTLQPCPSDATVQALTAQARQLTNAAPWTPAEVVGTLTSLTVTGTGGLWDMVDQSGTVLTGLPAGLSLTWVAEDGNALAGPTSITPQAAATVVANWTVRP